MVQTSEQAATLKELMPRGYTEGPAAEEAERRLEELERACRGGAEERLAVVGSTADDPERHFLGWLGEVDPDELFESGVPGGSASSERRKARTTRTWRKPVEQLDQVIIRFAGDSGDGMQLTGDRFTSETAMLGNDLSTLPDFPAEIRAPAGSLPGVSGFQLHFADHDILTPGDAPNVLVAMNPAALKTNLGDLPKGGTLIVDTRHLQGAQPPEGGLRGEPARGRLARRLPRARGRRSPR